VPPELNQLGHGRGFADDDGATVHMGDGNCWCEYSLRLDPHASASGTNVYQLYLYGDGPAPRHLSTIRLPAGASFPPDTMLQIVMAGFDADLQKNPADETAYRGRVQAYLQLNHVPEARLAFHQMFKALPDNWWAALGNALLVTEEQSPEHGTHAMVQWVNGHEDFFSYLNLAYFYHLTNRPREAAAAIIKSMDFDANASRGSAEDSKWRGYTAAMCAYRAGDYQASLQLCDYLRAMAMGEDYAKQGLRNLKAASENALKGQVESVPWDDKIVPFDPYERLDIEKLLGRKVPRPTRKQPTP
jgi:tetratricopeptide (TPR) repeat protein